MSHLDGKSLEPHVAAALRLAAPAPSATDFASRTRRKGVILSYTCYRTC